MGKLFDSGAPEALTEVKIASESTSVETRTELKPVYIIKEVVETVEKPMFRVSEAVQSVQKPAFVVKETIETIAKPTFEVKDALEIIEKPIFKVEEVESLLRAPQQVINTKWVLVLVALNVINILLHWVK